MFYIYIYIYIYIYVCVCGFLYQPEMSFSSYIKLYKLQFPEYSRVAYEIYSFK